MKLAIATRGFEEVSGHAGKAREWLVYAVPGGGLAPDGPERVTLAADQIFHLATEDRPHPLDGVGLVIARSAGDGFVRHMARRGAEVVLTAERDPARVIAQIVDGQALAEPGLDPARLVCKLRDLFSRY